MLSFSCCLIHASYASSVFHIPIDALLYWQKPEVERIPQASQGKARDQAAQLANVNSHSIFDAKKIQATVPDENASDYLVAVKEPTITQPAALLSIFGRTPQQLERRTL